MAILTFISVGHFNIRNTSYKQRCLNFWKSAKHEKDAKDLNGLTRKQVTTEAALHGTILDPIHMVQKVPPKYTLSDYFFLFIRLFITTFLILFGFQDTMTKTGMIKGIAMSVLLNYDYELLTFTKSLFKYEYNGHFLWLTINQPWDSR